MAKLLEAWGNVKQPVIGMLHLAPLPGSPLYGGSMETVRSAVMRDAELLAEGGVHGLMIENFGDTPFYPGRVPSYVVAHMTAMAGEVKRRHPKLPLGINVLRNDGLSALSVAHAVGAEYIRVNVRKSRYFACSSCTAWTSRPGGWFPATAAPAVAVWFT